MIKEIQENCVRVTTGGYQKKKKNYIHRSDLNNAPIV